jgi:formate dehydrogenase major subunit
MYPRSMLDSDCVVIQGSNMAENHPVAFRWPMQAKLRGAKLIHVDPRFTRTSAVADIHAPIRSGSDVAFLGGLINHVLQSERWNTDPFFREFVVSYTNAATIIGEAFKDTEDLDGVFSGLMQYTPGIKEWPLDGFVGRYDPGTWRYAAPAASRASAPPPSGPPFDSLVRSLLTPLPPRDETLQHPRTVFQIVKRHFSRYTPEMVERVTGCAKATFQEVADTILANSGRDRTTSFAYAVAWTQHTNGPQTIGCCALLQLLLGNIGRPGAGVMALRGHASIQGSTDVPTLCAQEARLAARLAPHRDHAPRILGQHAEVHGLVPQVHVRGRGHRGQRLPV